MTISTTVTPTTVTPTTGTPTTGTPTTGTSRRAGSRVSSDRRQGRLRRHARLRKKISGSAERPRLAVNRSARHMVVQLIDDRTGHTLASASSMEPDVRALDGDKTARAVRVGELLAARAREVGVTTVVFDRGGYGYHGRVAALADAAREGGLRF